MATTEERYTHGHHESVLRSHRWRTVANSAAYLAPYLEPGSSLIDIGCGPGTITVDFARHLSAGRVVGVDASAEVLEEAAALAADNGLTNVSFATGDAYHLDAADDEFDIAHAHQVLQHLADPVAALKEMRRVVAPGGIVAVRDADYGGMISYPSSEGLEDWLRVYQTVQRADGHEPDAGRRLKSWALEAGFSSVTSTASIWCFESDADREWWGQMWADRVLNSQFEALAIESGAATLDDLKRISGAWREWSGTPSAWFAAPHGEVIARK